MLPKSTSSDACEGAITACLVSLRHRIAEVAARGQALGEVDNPHQVASAIGALAGLDSLLAEISVLHDAVLILYRTTYMANPTRTRATDSRSPRDVANVHKEVDELAKLGAITPKRAALLKERLTASVIAEHLGHAMSVTELVDMYNNLLAAEETPPHSPRKKS